MKIGILTFHCAANYGAVMQAYGLQEYLRLLGHTAHIIDYRPDYLFKPYRSFSYTYHKEASWSWRIKCLVRSIMVFPIRYRRNSRFKRFINKYLSPYQLDLNSKDEFFDAFVFGSDQIWNPTITRGMDSIYLGDFEAAEGKIKIAYAASAGTVRYLGTSDLSTLQHQLSKFNAISVREHSLQTMLSNNNINDVKLVLDPVLLAGHRVFENITLPVSIHKPYLLLFQLFMSEEVECYARELAKKKGLDFIKILSMGESIKDKNLKHALSPGEFLGYIKNAAYVVTTSFHGTAFSVLFEKEFTTIKVSDDIDERAKHLLSLVGLENRMSSLCEMKQYAAIDYSQVNKKLDVYRKYSSEFLINSLIC